jgi:hypothetical protein
VEEISDLEFERQEERLFAAEDGDMENVPAVEDVLDSNHGTIDRASDPERSRR